MFRKISYKLHREEKPLTTSQRHWLHEWLHDLSECLAEGRGREILNLRLSMLFFSLGTALKSDLYRFVGTYLPSTNSTWKRYFLLQLRHLSWFMFKVVQSIFLPGTSLVT